jgi:hypothetical protein
MLLLCRYFSDGTGWEILRGVAIINVLVTQKLRLSTVSFRAVAKADLEIVVDPGNNVARKDFQFSLAESFEISFQKLSIKC